MLLVYFGFPLAICLIQTGVTQMHQGWLTDVIHVTSIGTVLSVFVTLPVFVHNSLHPFRALNVERCRNLPLVWQLAVAGVIGLLGSLAYHVFMFTVFYCGELMSRHDTRPLLSEVSSKLPLLLVSIVLCHAMIGSVVFYHFGRTADDAVIPRQFLSDPSFICHMGALIEQGKHMKSNWKWL
jgi:hypothetical protein